MWEVLNCDSAGRRAAGEVVYMSRRSSMRRARTVDRNTPTSMGVGEEEEGQ